MEGRMKSGLRVMRPVYRGDGPGMHAIFAVCASWRGRWWRWCDGGGGRGCVVNVDGGVLSVEVGAPSSQYVCSGDGDGGEDATARNDTDNERCSALCVVFSQHACPRDGRRYHPTAKLTMRCRVWSERRVRQVVRSVTGTDEGGLNKEASRIAQCTLYGQVYVRPFLSEWPPLLSVVLPESWCKLRWIVGFVPCDCT
eukprot:3107863-Rhodomonas_salina.1